MKKVFLILLLIFFPNLVWEMSQALLFAPHFLGAADFIRIHVIAALSDVVLVAIVLILGTSLSVHALCDGKKKERIRLLSVAAIGFLAAVTIERFAIASGLWAYGPLMPIIPVFGVGLTPVLQMTVIPTFIAWLYPEPTRPEISVRKDRIVPAGLVVAACCLVMLGISLPEPRHSTEPVSVYSEPQREASDIPAVSVAEPGDTVRVGRVIDGDTIRLTDGRTVRYIGIDAPETVDPKRSVQCFGKEASAEDRRLVEGKEVRIVKDVSETDRYGRLLRYVYEGDTFVNEALVRGGFARAEAYPPDVRYRDLFGEAEHDAKTNHRGLWADGACAPAP